MPLHWLCRILFVQVMLMSGCSQQPAMKTKTNACATVIINEVGDQSEVLNIPMGALLLTQFTTLEELKEVVDIEYDDRSGIFGKPLARITHNIGGTRVVSTLTKGVDEGDFNKARDGDLWDRVRIAFKTPFAVAHRKDLVSIELLGRRRYEMFGEGDIAFYDIALQMAENIRQDDIKSFSERDMSEKGYLNTFNHITAQALMTAVYSEKLADFVADVHERFTMPELITGNFSDDQLADLEKGPVDNYVDMINNEWGQELGKLFVKKYRIDKNTHWTPELLANLLNDIQRHCSHALDIRFSPFHADQDMIIRFANKINIINSDVSEYIQFYFDRVKLDMSC